MTSNLISIITPVYNSLSSIQDCIDSVLNQNESNVEHLVIDGGSNDGTVDLLKKQKINYISEKDDGIYDAMNKGIKNVSGDIIGILNSDDLYFDCDVLSTVKKAFIDYDSDIVFGNIVLVDKNNLNKVVRTYKTTSYFKKMFYSGVHPPHPGFFVKKDVYERYGYFSLKYKVASYYEFMLRVLEKYRLNSVFIDKNLVKMRVGGVSNNSLKSIIKNNIECRQAWIDNNLNPPKGLILKKPLSKVKQFFG